MKLIATIVASGLLAGTSLADTINVPGDYSTVQAAVDAAVDGDTILIAQGKQYESGIVVSGISLTISGAVSKGGEPATSIIGNGTSTLLSTTVSTGDSLVIENLVITGGLGWLAGGMSNVSDDGGGSLLVRNTRITSNAASTGGEFSAGGIYNYAPLSDSLCDYSVTFDNCQISSNTLNFAGYLSNYGCVAGGMANQNCRPTLNNCDIDSNNLIVGSNLDMFCADVVLAGGIASNVDMSPSYIAACGIVLNGCRIRSNSIQYSWDYPTGAGETPPTAAGGIAAGSFSPMTLNYCTLCGNGTADPYTQTSGGFSFNAAGYTYLNSCVQGTTCLDLPGDTLYDMVMQQQTEIELLQDALAACCAERCIGDVDEDHDVDVEDILLLLANYGLACP